MKKIRNNFTNLERRLKFTYKQFIDNCFWTKQKLDWYSRHKKRCAICKKEIGVNLHHKNYPKNGRYLSLRDNSFVALCRKHHLGYHKKYGVEQFMHLSTNNFIK